MVEIFKLVMIKTSIVIQDIVKTLLGITLINFNKIIRVTNGYPLRDTCQVNDQVVVRTECV